MIQEIAAFGVSKETPSNQKVAMGIPTSRKTSISKSAFQTQFAKANCPFCIIPLRGSRAGRASRKLCCRILAKCNGWYGNCYCFDYWTFSFGKMEVQINWTDCGPMKGPPRMNASKMKPIWKTAIALIFLFVASVSTLRSATLMTTISGFTFVPSNLTINTGDVVTWVNNDTTAHTTTSGQPGTATGLWDSGVLAPGQSFSQTFNSSGTFPYYCTLHTSMTGAITVQGPQSTVPLVMITSPTNNTSVSSPTNVTIAATASTTAGTIVTVEFFDGGTSLGVVSSRPFSIDTTLGVGIHSLSAKATASSGESSISATVIVKVGGGGSRITDPIPQKIPKADIAIDLQFIADGFASPVGMAAPDDNSGRLFVYDQNGLVEIVTGTGVKTAAPLLDVRNRLVRLNPRYDERGLIGLAAHPNFAQHPFIYTYIYARVGAGSNQPTGGFSSWMMRNLKSSKLASITMGWACG